MDDQTRSLIQKLLDLNSANTKSIASLRAYNALQNHVIIAMLSHMNEGATFDQNFKESYESIRAAALKFMSMGDEPEGLNAMLSVLDKRFG
jgi:ABC-type tungstate transport system permease subunit